MIVLCLFFAVSLTALAIGDNYDMSSDLKRLGDEEGRTSNAVRSELLLPSDYLSAGFVENEGIYYFELKKEMDPSVDIDFSFWFKGIQCRPTEAQSKTNFMPYFKVYGDSSLSSDSLVASYENGKLIWDSQDQNGIDTSTEELAAQHNNESILRFHVASGTLEADSTYYLVMENGLPNPKFPVTMRLPGNGIYQFKTKKIATGKESSDGNIATLNEASFTATPSFVTKEGDKTSAPLFINHDSSRYEVDGEVPYQGSLELNVTMTPQSNKKASHLLAYVIDPDNPEVKLQEFNIADDTETKIENTVIAVDTSGLTSGKTYYFVMDKTSQSGMVSFGEDVIFAFATHTHSPITQYGISPGCEAVGYTDQISCSSCGTVLKEREEIPALGHDWVDMPAEEATCTTPGKLPYQQCSRCRIIINYFTDQSKPMLGHVPVVTKEGTVTCTEPGLCEEIVCSRCNQNIQLQKEVEALGHDYVDGVCTRCGEKVELVDYAANEWQGNSISIHWTTPTADTIKTEGLLKDAEGTPYYYNEFTAPFCADSSKTFAFDVKGQGANHIGEEGNESPADHIFVYSDASLSEESLVASAAKGTIADVKRANAAVTEEGMSNILFTIPAGALENDQTYYIVIDEKLESNQSRYIGTKIVNKITTKHGELEEVPAFKPACTEAGREAGTMCKECKNYLEGGKEIPALGHDYKDGVCTRCGEKDPNYVEPTPAEPVVNLNGLEKGKDGKWALYKDNVVQKDFTGLAKSSYTKNWYYVKNGYVDWNYTGFGQNVDTKKWYRVKNGRVDWDANSIYKKPETGAWYKCYEGRVTFNQTGVYKNENGWWYCKNSKVDFNFTGIASNKNGTWYIKNGYVDFNYSGKVVYNGKTYNVTKGHAKLA